MVERFGRLNDRLGFLRNAASGLRMGFGLYRILMPRPLGTSQEDIMRSLRKHSSKHGTTGTL